MGRFFAFEGIDGSGKDTQLDMALALLRSHDKYVQVWIAQEPTRFTQAGREILDILRNGSFDSPEQALALYAADRTEQSPIRKQLLSFSHILVSRCDLSAYAFQGAQGLSFEQIAAAHDYEKVLVPDVTFYFDLSMEEAERRLQKKWDKIGKRDAFEKLDFLALARQKYLEAIPRLQATRRIEVIDAAGTPEEVFARIADTILEVAQLEEMH